MLSNDSKIGVENIRIRHSRAQLQAETRCETHPISSNES